MSRINVTIAANRMRHTTMSKERKLLERIIKHFEKQGRFARDDHGCVYRKIVEGRICKCALGCLVPKSKYNPDMEKVALYSDYGDSYRHAVLKTVLVDLGLYEHKEFLASMQYLHDNYALGRGMSNNFNDFMTELKGKREVYV